MKYFLRSISCIVLAACVVVTLPACQATSLATAPTTAPTAASTNPPTSQATSPTSSLEMVALTPAFPVVRDKAVLQQSSRVNFSAAFLAQQRAAFGNNPADEFNRMTRYELGKIAHHDPLSAFGTVSETCLLYTSPSPRDRQKSRMPSSA